MEKIGNILAGLAQGREERMLGPERAALARMTRLPSTPSLASSRAEILAAHQRVLAELAAEAEQLNTPAERLAAEMRDRVEQECWAALGQLDQELEAAQERDRLQAERPAGCTCLGVGGTGHLLPFVSYVLWSTWCSCPESLSLQAEARRVDAEIKASRADEEAQVAAAEQALRMARANLPPRLSSRSWADFEGTPGKVDGLRAMRQLGTADKGRGVYLSGTNGTGKTTLVVLAVRDWVQRGGTALFLAVPDLLDMLRPGGREMAEEVADSQADLMARLCSVGLLVLDDIGAQKESGWTRDRLFLIINRRYDAGRVTVLTSNYKLGEMAARMAGDDERVEGNRIAWRIQETCELIELGGKNYRERPGERPAPSSRNGTRHLAAVGVRLPYADDRVEELPL